MAHQVKNPPAMQETQKTPIGFLDQEDPLKKEILWTEEPGGLQSKGSQRYN